MGAGWEECTVCAEVHMMHPDGGEKHRIDGLWWEGLSSESAEYFELLSRSQQQIKQLLKRDIKIPTKHTFIYI